jgi:hypothetical protein
LIGLLLAFPLALIRVGARGFLSSDQVTSQTKGDQVMKIIPLDLLRKKRACQKQLSLVESEWPSGIPLTKATAERFLELELNIDWVVENLLTEQEQIEYERIQQLAKAEYERIIQPALAEYKRIIQPAWAEYLGIKQPALAEYLRKKVMAILELLLKRKETK